MKKEQSVLERHAKLTLVVLNLALLALMIAAFEIYARLTATYAIDYYAGAREPGTHERAYGIVKINSLGFPDEEFDLGSAKPRVGYVGDSVNFGVGAGFGYRLSDLMRVRFPDLEHWNVGAGVATGLGRNKPVERADTFRLGTVVYLLNLNDLEQLNEVASRKSTSTPTTALGAVRTAVHGSVDYLRDKSYAYNYIRFAVKNLFQRWGYEGAKGLDAIELFPGKHQDRIDKACGQINAVYDELKARDVDLCVIVLPYEMQVSREAADRYRALGFRWEPGFEEGSTQERLERCLAVPHVYDARAAFDSARARVGQYFVYDRGDKIDWNHPNREGHARITEGFVQSKACGFLDGQRVARRPG